MTPSDPAPTLTTLATRAGQDAHTPLLPALTILWHPELERIGETAVLDDLLRGQKGPVRRSLPLFRAYPRQVARGLDHRAVSDADVSFSLSPLGGSPAEFLLERGTTSKPVEVDGQPLLAPITIAHADLASGLVISLARRIVLCLHYVRFPVVRSDDNLDLLGPSDAMDDARSQILRAARADLPVPVLIRGATGVGKEAAALAVHRNSPRARGPFVAVNMSRLSGPLADAELFGHVRGAFTDAKQARPGLFTRADGGTLFLDEIGETPREVQAKLLRVLEDRTVQPIGAEQARTVDVRVVTATDAPLEDLVVSGAFDDALYFRLNAFPITLPPLGKRREDIGVLFATALRRALERQGQIGRLVDDEQQSPWFPAQTMVRIARAPWPGNVRELQNLAEAIAAQSVDNPTLDVDDYVRARLEASARIARDAAPGAAPPSSTSAAPPARGRKRGPISLDDLLATLERTRLNRSEAARTLGISRKSLYELLRERHPALGQVLLEIPFEAIVREHASCGGDIAALARKLSVPPEVLLWRLRMGADGDSDL